MFNKTINFTTSELDQKLKISSVKLDGSDEIAITGLTITKITSLNLLHLSYGTEVPTDRSIKLETLAGFKLISEEAKTISEISKMFCPLTTSDIAVSNAAKISSNTYELKLMKISSTSNTFKSTGELDGMNFAVLGLAKYGTKSNHILKAKTTITEKLVVLELDMNAIANEGVKGSYEVLVFYHSGLGIGGEKSEDKKYLSENFVPRMIRVSLSSALSTMAIGFASLVLLLSL